MTRGVQVIELPATGLIEYGRIPTAFCVERILDVQLIAGGLGGVALVERVLAQPYVKDYDAIEGNAPCCWAKRWDLSNWVVLSARNGGASAGGAVVALATAGVDMLEGRNDLAVLWDIRVHPEHRRSGIGRALFAAAEALALARGCRELKVETQTSNVAACRFYAGQGCTLATFNRFAYQDCPEETQLIWRKTLVGNL